MPYYTGFTPLFRKGFSSAKIYGASWDKTTTSTLTRTDDAIGLVANIGIDNQVVVNDFDNAEIYKDIVEMTDSYGNKFMRIPKFYIKKTDGAGYKTWQVSKKPFAGAYLPWCFWNFSNGQELPYLDFGKYRASLNGTKLESKTGKAPLVNTNIVDFRTYAQNNGVGYQQIDMHALDVIRTLFYIEFATINSQNVALGYVYGQYSDSHITNFAETSTNRIILTTAYADAFSVGQTISIGTSRGGNQIFYARNIISIDTYDASNKAIVFEGTAVDISIGNIVYNTGQITGSADNITASSGSPRANDGKNIFSYRGIESLWGDAWCFIDGININDNELWICDNANEYASNVFAVPYKKASYSKIASNGYAKNMGHDALNQSLEFPIEVGNGSGENYGDYFYQATGQRVARLGGGWNNGSRAGLACWSLDDSSTRTYVTIGGRFLKKPL